MLLSISVFWFAVSIIITEKRLKSMKNDKMELYTHIEYIEFLRL